MSLLFFLPAFSGLFVPCHWSKHQDLDLTWRGYALLHNRRMQSGITGGVQVRQSISISAELAQALRMRSDSDNISMSAVVCQLLSRELAPELAEVRKRFEELVKQGELFESEKHKP